MLFNKRLGLFCCRLLHSDEEFFLAQMKLGVGDVLKILQRLGEEMQCLFQM